MLMLCTLGFVSLGPFHCSLRFVFVYVYFVFRVVLL